MSVETTIVKEEVDDALMAEIFGGFNGTPKVEPPTPFSRKLETSFLDAADDDEKKEEGKGDTQDDPFEDLVKTAKEDKPIVSSSSPTILVKLIKEGSLFAFDDGKKPEEYDDKEAEDLILANLEDARNQGRDEAFADMPEEIEYLRDYIKSGGTDITGTLSMLGQVREQRELDVANPDHHEMIIRNYMILKDEPDELIESEIAALKDRKGSMEAKAKIVKPLLDKILKDDADAHLKEQQEYSRKLAESRAAFAASVKATVEKGDLNGIKIDPKMKTSLVEGLVSMTHKSVSGKATNLMGKLLEEYTTTKPNLALVMEALYLLSNPDEYRSKVRQSGANLEAEKNRKLLKQAEAEKATPDSEKEPDETGSPRVRKLPVQRNILDSINRDRNR